MKILKTILFAGLCACYAYGFSQPAVLGTDIQSGSYSTYNLFDLGIFRQYRLQATAAAAAGIRKWEFCVGTAASPDYSTNWRPYSGACNANPDLSIPGYNQTISPDLTYPSGYASAPFNTAFGGCSGYLGSITSNDYYTFNISEDYYGTPPGNEYMSVLQTTYNPVSIISVTQSPLAAAVYPENSVYVTITTSGSLSAGEYMYLRYASSYNFASSTLLNVTMTGTTGTVEIPCTIAGDSIYYYAYSSNRTSAVILTEVAALAPDGEVAHDMSTLSINNNGGPNYSYKVNPSVGFCGNYYVPSVCYPTIASFVTALNAGTVSCPVICNVAAGHTETAPAGGINLTQTGTAINTITFIKNGVGANPVIYAPVGTANFITLEVTDTYADGIFSLNGSDYITIDGIDLVDNNLTMPESMEYGYGLFKSSSTDGTQNNTIRNCYITLNAANNWTGTPTNYEFGSVGILIRNSVRTSLQTLLTIATASGRSDNNQFYGNTISNVFNGFVIAGYNDATSAQYDQNNSIGIAGAGNSIQHFGHISAGARAEGIYAIYQTGLTITDNTINNSAGGGTAHNFTLYGIFISSQISGTYTQSILVSNNTISLLMNNLSTRMTAIKVGNSTATATSVTVSGNTIENCTYVAGASGDYYGIDIGFNASTISIADNIIQNNVLNTSTTSVSYLIFNSVTSPTVSITGNSLLNNTKTVSSSGHLYGIYGVNTSATGTAVIDNNTIDVLSVPSAAAAFCVGIRLTSAVAQIKTITNNTVQNITGGTSTTAYTAGILSDFMPAGSSVSNNTVNNVTSGSVAIGINCSFANSVLSSNNISFDANNNSVFNIFPKATLGYGIALGGSSACTTINCNGNTVDNVTCGVTIGSLAGIRTYSTSATGSFNLSGNKISNISHTAVAGCTIAGIYAIATTPTTISGNSIYNVSGLTSSDVAHGIYFNGSSGSATINNNYIQRITCPNSFSNPAVYGISFQPTGTYNVYYNTIALGENTPLTFAANGGAAGLYFSATSTVNFSNNIIYVNANPTGTGVAACLKRITVGTAFTPATNISAISNNNYYYLNPGTWNYIYVEGGAGGVAGSIVNGYAWSGATTNATYNLNNDPCFNVITPSDFTSYKYFMSTAGGGTREANSYYDIPPFAGGAILPDNLKLTTGATTYAESGAMVIAGITTDYEGDARSGTTPDIGADEGAFVVQPPDCYLLPLELISFTGWYNGVENELHWTTATEINSDYFGVQKSTNGIDFYTIGEVDAAGNSLVELNYEFFDDDPVPGINYYRLKMTDIDGEFEYSNTIAIRVDQDGTPLFVVYPNPVSSDLNFSINSLNDQIIVVEISDIPGRKLLNRQFDLHSGQNTFSIDISALAAAPYFIYYFNDRGEQQVIQFIKE